MYTFSHYKPNSAWMNNARGTLGPGVNDLSKHLVPEWTRQEILDHLLKTSH